MAESGWGNEGFLDQELWHADGFKIVSQKYNDPLSSIAGVKCSGKRCQIADVPTALR